MPSSHPNWPARIFCVVALGLGAAILYPIIFRVRESGGNRNGCQSNLKQMGLGFIQYTQDYNEKFPLVATGRSAYGWADAIYPYIKSVQVYQCPKEPTAGQSNPRKSGYTDYSFNKRMSGKAADRVDEPAIQILSLDGNAQGDVTDARYSLAQIPNQWRQDPNSPLYRHNGVANYLFADGHVKSFGPTQVENANSPVF